MSMFHFVIPAVQGQLMRLFNVVSLIIFQVVLDHLRFFWTYADNTYQSGVFRSSLGRKLRVKLLKLHYLIVLCRY